MLSMIIFTLGIDQNIINEHNYKLIQIIMKDPIHILHEYTRCISNTKRHNRILIMTIPCPKSSLLNILRLHTNLMIPRPQINLAKHTSSNQLIHQIINPWKWILVLNRYFVQLPIINTKSHRTFLLLNQQNRCTPWRYTRTNKILLQQILKLTLQLFQRRSRHPIWSHRYRTSSRNSISRKLNFTF